MSTSAPIAARLAPDFTLPDRFGRAFNLHQNLAPGGTVLVFYRGHWCPYCRRYLSKLRDAMPRFAELGAKVVAISPEPVQHAALLAAELQIDFPLLSDVDGVAIDAYGTRNSLFTNAAPFRGRGLIPHPAVFVISAAGEIRFRAIDRNYKKRTTLRSILTQLEQLRAEYGLPAVQP